MPWNMVRRKFLKENVTKVVGGIRVVRDIPWELNVPKTECPCCGCIYEGDIEWKGNLWKEKDIYAITIEKWQDGLSYVVKCLSCNEWIVFDPEKQSIQKYNK